MNNVIIFLGTSAFVWGIYAMFRPHMIFSRIGKLIWEYAPSYLAKPLIGCPACMGFWYGLVGFSLTDLPAPYIFIWPIMMVGFNYYIGQLMYSDDE